MTVVAAVRRFLEMLNELHKLRYERLRIAPEIADTPGGGAWRAWIVPVTCISRRHGGLVDHAAWHKLRTAPFLNTRAERCLGDPLIHASTSARESAERLLALHPDTAQAGSGADAEYVQWYRAMLETTAPDAAPYTHRWQDALEGFPPPEEHSYMRARSATREIILPLPPPGVA